MSWLAVALVGITLRFWRFARRELWADELEQLHSLSFTLPDLLTRYLPDIPGGFPGDYVLTWPFAQLSTHKWFVALPHIGATCVGFWLFFLIIKRDVATLAGRIVAWGLFSLNSTLIFHSLELRPYAVLPTLALALFWIATEWAPVTSRWSRGMHVAWIVLLVLTLVFHVYGVVMCTFILIFALVQRPTWSARFRVIKDVRPSTLAAAALAAGPMWYFVNTSNIAAHHIKTFEFSGSSPAAIVKFILANLFDVSLRWGWLIPTALVCVGLCVPDSRLKQRWSTGFWLVLCPLLFILIQDIQTHYWFLQRQFVWVIPFASLLAAQCADALAGKRPVS